MSERKEFFGLRYPDRKSIFFDRFGVEFQVSGVVFKGRDGVTLILMLPGEDVEENNEILTLDKDQWIEVLQYLDNPTHFETDETGVVKAIHRKTSRSIADIVAWEVYKKAGYKCEYCLREAPLTIDHYLPVEAGGTDEPENLRAACRSCNKRKANLLPEEWEARRARS